MTKYFEKIISDEIKNIKIFIINSNFFSNINYNNLLYGFDNIIANESLITELYLIYNQIPKHNFIKLKKTTQANIIWNELFVNKIPLSNNWEEVITLFKLLNIEILSERNIDVN